jgi:hypothetical protein
VAGFEAPDDSDPHEYKNLVKDPGHEKAVGELKQLLKDGWKSARPGQGGSN